MYHELINHATRQYPFFIKHTDVKYIPHFHEETELVFVLEGALDVTLENNTFVLNEGEICIITPDLIHNLYSREPNITFVIKLFPVIDLGNIVLTTPVVSPGSANYEFLRQHIYDIIEEDEKRLAGYELSVNINAEKILLMILRNIEHQKSDDKFKLQLANKNDFLTSVTSFLETHYAEDFLLEDVAKYLNYTKSYFCHYFKRVTGVTFWRYYTIFRLEKSIQAMKKHPGKRYMEIAQESGFKNIRSFNQAFKEYHHCTPREYLNKYYSTP